MTTPTLENADALNAVIKITCMLFPHTTMSKFANRISICYFHMITTPQRLLHVVNLLFLEFKPEDVVSKYTPNIRCFHLPQHHKNNTPLTHTINDDLDHPRTSHTD